MSERKDAEMVIHADFRVLRLIHAAILLISLQASFVISFVKLHSSHPQKIAITLAILRLFILRHHQMKKKKRFVVPTSTKCILL